MDNRNINIWQSVKRKIPGYARVIQALLYVFVVLFAVIGAMMGAFWLIPALGTLIGAWYYMGQARVTYRYQLEGVIFRVARESGFLARPKKEDFLELDLRNLIAMGREDDPRLTGTEQVSAAASPKRIIYDVSEHNSKNPPMVLYATGIGRENGRHLKVYLQPDEDMLRVFKRIGSEKVYWNEYKD